VILERPRIRVRVRVSARVRFSVSVRVSVMLERPRISLGGLKAAEVEGMASSVFLVVRHMDGV